MAFVSLYVLSYTVTQKLKQNSQVFKDKIISYTIIRKMSQKERKEFSLFEFLFKIKGKMMWNNIINGLFSNTFFPSYFQRMNSFWKFSNAKILVSLRNIVRIQCKLKLLKEKKTILLHYSVDRKKYDKWWIKKNLIRSWKN